MFHGLEIATGIGLVLLTLRDVFDTVVVPGATQGWLRVAERVRRATQPGWRRLQRARQGPPRISRSFAPFLLLTTFAAWMLLLLLGFSLIAHALAAAFVPPLRSFGQAVYAVGSAIFTIGIGQQGAEGAARWVEIGAGGCGLAVMTLVITYILQVQNGLHSRDGAILKLSVTAGRPPSGIALLETYAELDCRDELDALFAEWRDWTASTLHRQSSHPVVTYFRSMSAGMDWPAALGAVLDAATLATAFLEHRANGRAALLQREGARLAAVMAEIFELEVCEQPPPRAEEVEQLLERLRRAGYRLRTAPDPERFARLRGDYVGRLAAIADHLGADGLTLAA